MSKKKIILISVIVIVVLAVVVFISVSLIQSSQVSSPVTSLQPTPTVTEEELITWTDPAEFSFQYPKSLTVDPHDEDEKNYAHVELKSATHSGNLIVWVKDTTAEDIMKWERVEKIQNAIDSNLGGEEAKKVLLRGENSNIVTSSIYGGYLYQIEVNPVDFDFWTNIYEQIVSSFKFVPAEATDSETPVVNTDEEVSTEVPEGEVFEEEFIE